MILFPQCNVGWGECSNPTETNHPMARLRFAPAALCRESRSSSVSETETQKGGFRRLHPPYELLTCLAFLQIIQSRPQQDGSGGHHPFFLRFDILAERIVFVVLTALKIRLQSQRHRVSLQGAGAQECQKLGPNPAQMNDVSAVTVFASAQHLNT